MSPMAMPHRDPGLYFPVVPGSRGALQMLVHARGDPLSIVPRLRELAMTVDPTLRIGTPERLDRLADPHVWFVGLWMRITIGLTAIALLLSLAGIYAVLSYTVAKRTREIGVRVALGADSRSIERLVVGEGLRLATVGLVVGLLSAVASTRLLAGLLHGVSPADPTSFVAIALLVAAIAVVASYMPARRAVRIDPVVALRAE